MGHTRLIVTQAEGASVGPLVGMRDRMIKDYFRPLTSLDRAVGWCNPEGPHLDMPTGVHEVSFDGIVYLGVRVDAMTIPAGTVRLKAKERAREIQETEKRGVWEEELKDIESEIREEIRKTQTEAAKWFRVWWHVDDGEMFAETTSRTDLDDLRRMFTYATGGCVATVATVGGQLVRCDVDAARALCREATISINVAEDDDTRQIRNTSVLDEESLAWEVDRFGPEFLLWVWMKSERNGGTWSIPSGVIHGTSPTDENWDTPEDCIIHPSTRLTYSVPGAVEDVRGYKVFEATAPRQAMLAGATIIGYGLKLVLPDRRPGFHDREFTCELVKGAMSVAKEVVPELHTVSNDEAVHASHRHDQWLTLYRVLDFVMLAWARWAATVDRESRGAWYASLLELSLLDTKRGEFARTLAKPDPKIQVEIDFAALSPVATEVQAPSVDAGASAVSRARAGAGASDA